MTVYLFKDGDHMGIVAENADDSIFSDEFASLLAAMIEDDMYKGDWEFQLQRWLTHFTILERELWRHSIQSHSTGSGSGKVNIAKSGEIDGPRVAKYVTGTGHEPFCKLTPHGDSYGFLSSELEAVKTRLADALLELKQRTKQVIELQELLAKANER